MAHSKLSSRSSNPNRNPSPSPPFEVFCYETCGNPRREEMLKALANQTLAKFDIQDLSTSDNEYADEEEWEGIVSEGEDQVQDGEDYSIADSDEDFDDGQDLHLEAMNPSPVVLQIKQQEPEVVVFHDPSMVSPNDRKCVTNHSERKAFMASMLKKQNRNDAQSGSSTVKRKRASNMEDEEEAKLQHLDRSLSNLVSHLSGPKKTSISLDAILSSTLPPPTKDKNPQRHPRAIKEGMARAQLQRSLAADQEALVSGTVRAKNSKTLTKRQKRTQDGTAERERRARRAQVDRGSIGKTVGGGMIKLTPREIKMGMNNSNPYHKSARSRR